MHYPLVSVIVPVYNMGPFLAETLDSILASTYPNIEIIIMDDGSTDNSIDIAKTYAQQHPTIQFYQQTNAGVSVARNHAIRIAQGAYILPVDSDNRISPQYIEKAVQVLQQNTNIKVVSCKAMQFGERNGEWKFPPFSYKLLARKNMIDNCAMYRKTDWAKAGGYCETILGREDWDFWISMFKTGGQFERINHIGLYYRVRSNSKRYKTQKRKKLLIDELNQRHKRFMFEQLGGPLHYKRTWSTLINRYNQLFNRQVYRTYSLQESHKDMVYNLPQMGNTPIGSIVPVKEEQQAYVVSLPAKYQWNKKEKIEQLEQILAASHTPAAQILGGFTQRHGCRINQNLLLLQIPQNNKLISLEQLLEKKQTTEMINLLIGFIDHLKQAAIYVRDPHCSIAYMPHATHGQFIVLRPDLCEWQSGRQYNADYFNQIRMNKSNKIQFENHHLFKKQ